MKRIYFESVKKWAINLGIPTGVVGTAVGLIFLFLSLSGAITITGNSGDMVCAGTEFDPCYAYVNFTANEDIFIYPIGYDPWGRNTTFAFDPAVKSWKLQRSWGDGWRDIPLDTTCTGTWCGAPNNKGVKYSWVLREGKKYQVRVVAMKHNPSDEIKWAVNYEDKEYLDPSWLGVEHEIGYEFLNNDSVVHIWNTQDDYYFNKSSGIQFTNNYEDYWTQNVFCIGYYNNDEWNKIYCVDELEEFNREIETDNETYVNATLWKDINYNGYDLRLGLQYHLGVNDSNLTITPYAKNIGIDIPFDLGFAWKMKEVNIPGLGEDYIDINGTSYALNDSYDLTFKNMGESYLKIHDKTKYLRLNWDNNLNYAVKMYGDGNQENFYSILLINAGHFNPGQEKSTNLYWIDADTAVDDSVYTSADEDAGLWGPYWTNTSHGIIITLDNVAGSPGVIIVRETTDSGESWGSRITQNISGTIPMQMAVFWDQEIPGNSGTTIHIAWLDAIDSAGSDELNYVSYTTAGGFGTVRTISSTLTVTTTPLENRVAITKTVSGNIIIAGSTQTEVFAYKSANQFATAATKHEYFEDGDDNQDFGGSLYLGQSFTIGTNGINENFDLTSIYLMLSKWDTPGTITAEIYAVDGSGFPTGSALSSGTINGNDLGTEWPGEWTEFSMSSYELQASTKYVFIFYCSPTGYAAIDWDGDYSGGGSIYSEDSGDTWGDYGADFNFQIWGEGAATKIADCFEDGTQEDFTLLYPASTADDDDAAGIFWDRSPNLITIKMYDDSADTWTESAVVAASDDTTHINMDAAVRHSDSHIILAAHNGQDTATDDVVLVDINPNSISSPGVTVKTNAWTDIAESSQCGILVNQVNDDIYLSILKGGVWESTTDVVYKISSDGGATWGDEQNYSEVAADDKRRVTAGRTVGINGGRWQPVWFNDDSNSIFINLVNDIEIGTETPDTCTYTSGDWSVDCSDNCVISSPVNIGANDLIFIGSGTFWVDTDIWIGGNMVLSDGCNVAFTDSSQIIMGIMFIFFSTTIIKKRRNFKSIW